jgi:hypothetical protein
MDIARGELADKEFAAMTERRAHRGEVLLR